MRRIILILLTICAVNGMKSQTLPAWTMQLPKAGNGTYMYVCEYAIGDSESQARNQAMVRVFQSTAMRLGQPVSSDAIFDAAQTGKDFKVISQEYNIPINKVCEYSERMKNGTFRVFVLCQVAKAGNVPPQWEEFNGCQNLKQYKNGVALVESIFIPGLGQMSKRHFGEGALTLVGETVLVSAGFGCYFVSREMLDIMRKPDVTFAEFSEAQKTYNNLRTTHYIVWGAAAALYIYNLCRAYTMTPKYKSALVVHPAIAPTPHNMSYGIGLTWNLRFKNQER